MVAINWNPFNSSEDKVIDSNKVSFYKGMPVFLNKSSDRSGSFFVISLNNKYDKNNENEDEVEDAREKIKIDLNHEWGHGPQAWISGVVPYALFVGLPSWQEWGSWGDYYNAPWEWTADWFGGVIARRRRLNEKEKKPKEG